MIRPYWFSDDRWAARGLLLGVVLLTLGMVYLTVLLNQWNNAFYSALQDKNMAAFRGQLFRVTWLITIFIFLAVYQVYLNQMLEIRWRRWLTDRYLRAWLSDGAYYRMQLQASETDNPDQRIAEDVQLLASHTLGLFTGGLRAIVTLVTFVAILWGLSGSLVVPVGGVTLHLPGYMVWVAVLYAILGTWVTDWLGRPLVRLNFDRQRYEADFRFSLVRFRENTEGVALYRGEADEFRGLSRTIRGRGEQLVGHHAPAKAHDLLHLRLWARRVDRAVHRRGAALLPRRARARRTHADEPGLPAGPGRTQLLRAVVQGDRGVVRGGRTARRLRAHTRLDAPTGGDRPSPRRGDAPHT
jgi:hypothetical protein